MTSRYDNANNSTYGPTRLLYEYRHFSANPNYGIGRFKGFTQDQDLIKLLDYK